MTRKLIEIGEEKGLLLKVLFPLRIIVKQVLFFLHKQKLKYKQLFRAMIYFQMTHIKGT